MQDLNLPLSSPTNVKPSDDKGLGDGLEAADLGSNLRGHACGLSCSMPKVSTRLELSPELPNLATALGAAVDQTAARKD
jgi:hypothetical protein